MGRLVWILSDKGVSPSTRRLLEAAEGRGHVATCVAPADLSFALGRDGSTVLAVVPHVVLARMGGATPRAAFDVLFALEALGVPVVSSAAALLVARDKALSALALRARGIPSPPSVWVSPGKLEEALDVIPGPPWILKIPAGHHGDGVALLRSTQALRAAVARLAHAEPRLLVQAYLPTATSDLRVVVVRGEAVAAMRRTAAAGEFRANLHRGASATALTPSPEIASLAVRAAAAVGLEIAGIDLVETPGGPLVLEVNASPGLVGIEAATGVDVARSILVAVEARAASSGGAAADEADERDGLRA